MQETSYLSLLHLFHTNEARDINSVVVFAFLRRWTTFVVNKISIVCPAIRNFTTRRRKLYASFRRAKGHDEESLSWIFIHLPILFSPCPPSFLYQQILPCHLLHITYISGIHNKSKAITFKAGGSLFQLFNFSSLFYSHLANHQLNVIWVYMFDFHTWQGVFFHQMVPKFLIFQTVTVYFVFKPSVIMYILCGFCIVSSVTMAEVENDSLFSLERNTLF